MEHLFNLYFNSKLEYPSDLQISGLELRMYHQENPL